MEFEQRPDDRPPVPLLGDVTTRVTSKSPAHVVAGAALFALIAVFGASKCEGSSTPRPPSPTSPHGSTISVDRIVRATSAASSARVAWSETGSSGSLSGTGSLDFRTNSYSLDVALSGSLARVFGSHFEAVGLLDHEYVKDFGTVGWCKSEEITTSSPSKTFGVEPTSVLTSLRPPATLQRIGTDTVRGIATTHYRIAHGSAWDEMWVDANDYLRRARNNRGIEGDTMTVEFFDFGVRLTPITTPMTTSRSC